MLSTTIACLLYKSVMREYVGDCVLNELDNQIARASELPLLDAAYSLWRYSESPWRKKDDLNDSKSGKSHESIDASNSVTFAKTFPKVVSTVIAAIQFRNENAYIGPVFYWLKRAHPRADDDALQNAIRAAVKFDRDCSRFFAYKSKNYIEDVTIAVDLASKENPAFTEPTQKSAHSFLCWAMR